MAASGNVPLKVESGMAGHLNRVDVYESVHPYEGAMAGMVSGYVRPLVAGDQFAGHFFDEQNNAAGASAAKHSTLRQGRYRAEVTITSVAITDVGKPVYASADNGYSLTPTTYSRVGTVVRYVTTNTAIVEFDTNPAAAIDVSQSGKDVTLTCGNDFTIQAGKTAADVAGLAAYDIDGSAFVNVVAVKSHATDVLLSFFGKTGGSQSAHIANSGLTAATQATTTEIRALAVIADALIAVMESYGLKATA
jgi:hypothetical protein